MCFISCGSHKSCISHSTLRYCSQVNTRPGLDSGWYGCRELNDPTSFVQPWVTILIARHLTSLTGHFHWLFTLWPKRSPEGYWIPDSCSGHHTILCLAAHARWLRAQRDYGRDVIVMETDSGGFEDVRASGADDDASNPAWTRTCLTKGGSDAGEYFWRFRYNRSFFKTLATCA